VSARTPSAFTCTVTPFAEDGKLDLDGVRNLVSRIGATGMGVFVGSASPGEGHSLTLDETEQLYGTAVEVLKGKSPVRAMGVEPRNANQLLQIVRIAESVGMDAMQLYSVDMGHGNMPTSGELERYFRALLDNMSIPAVLSSHIYNGFVIPPDLADRLLADYPHIIGFNVTNPDISYVTRFVDAVDGRADVHVGGAMQALIILSLGGQGFLCTDGNIIPGTCIEVIRAYERGDQAAMFDAYATVMRFMAVNRWPGGSKRFIKAVMKVLGLPGHYLRPPFEPLGPDAEEAIAESLRSFDQTILPKPVRG
jgi:4-hydroxy-tetrahydrodipicolinate synthase